MDMLDQYLTAIATQLPQITRDDIIAELRDTLLSRFEEREDELGRPLVDAEREAILRSTGHPLAVASRYAPGSQTLIGAELYPYWLFAAKAGLSILAVVLLLNLIARTVSGSADAIPALSQAVANFIGSGLGLIGSFTLIGAVCEHFGIRPRYLDRWKVKDLGFLRLSDPASWPASMAAMHADAPRRSRFRWRTRGAGSSALGSLVAGVLFVLWWVGALHFPAIISLGRGTAIATVVAAPIWNSLYVPILIYALLQIAVDGSVVVRPAAVRLHALLQVPVALAGLILTWIAFQAGDWLTLISPTGAQFSVHGGVSLLNGSAWSGLADGGANLPALAADLSVILSWTLVAAAAGQVIKIVASMWRTATGERVR
jgi:hypothetical protein